MSTDPPVVFVTLDGEETPADDDQLPYGGDFRDFLIDVGVQGYRASETFDETIARTVGADGPASDADLLVSLNASAAATFSSVTIAL